MVTASKPETRAFQAHTKKLLDLMIHSIYAHKDVFLRELISNASDAIDKIRFEALTKPEVLEGNSDFKIKLIPDKDAHTLTIVDNGIGMSYDEVVEHIGTIARSGSEAFAQRLKSAGSEANGAPASDKWGPDLIGQFGVGFYSAFMVAKRVILETCKAGEDHAVRWESTGDGEYTIERLAPTRTDGTRRERGTSITLFLRDSGAAKEDHEDEDAPVNPESYADPWTVRRIVKKYSDFISFPIVMDVEKFEVEKDEDGQPKEGAEAKKIVREETLNSMKALWTRQPSTIERAEYDAFYRHLSHDFQDPAEVIHFHVEGQMEWTALLFVPKKAPWDLFSRDPRRGLQLYIKRVFIADDVKDLLPEHFRFVKGLVDCADLPLNVSRETIQQDPMLMRIKKRITGKLTSHFKELLEKDRNKYEELWKELGPAIKEGFHYDPGSKDKLAEILLVPTTSGGLSTLAEIAERKVEGQQALYYLTGEKNDVLQNAPQLEVFRKRGVEVMLLGDPVDEILTSVLEQYKDLPLKSAARGEIEGLPEDEADKQKQEETAGQFKDLCERLKDLLKDEVLDVRLSHRLTDSAVCLVADEQGMSTQLERMMKAMGQEVPAQKRILELNPDHAAIQALRDLAQKDKGDERLQEYGEMLLDQALLAEGAPLRNPARFAQRVAQVMAQAAR